MTNTDLRATLIAARLEAEAFMSDMHRLELSWPEEHVTTTLWRNVAPLIKTAEFTKTQESEVGADWLWWWIDDDGFCFGMLVQAKKLHRAGNRFTIDFRYRDGQQMARLFETADLFAVPAMYALYFGGTDHRTGLTCGTRHRDPCARCATAGVSVLAGLLAENASLDPRYAAEDALRQSVALEELADGATGHARILDLRWPLEPSLREFLTQGQQGAKHVARTILAKVVQARGMQFSVVTRDRGETGVDGEPLFPIVPLDQGHMRVPYFPHVLRGLRTTLPGYVQDVLTDVEPPKWVQDNIEGIVVIRC